MDLQRAQCSACHTDGVSEAWPLFSFLPGLVFTLGHREEGLTPSWLPGNSGGKTQGESPAPELTQKEGFCWAAAIWEGFLEEVAP